MFQTRLDTSASGTSGEARAILDLLPTMSLHAAHGALCSFPPLAEHWEGDRIPPPQGTIPDYIVRLLFGIWVA